jgi:hypothetical protein
MPPDHPAGGASRRPPPDAVTCRRQIDAEERPSRALIGALAEARDIDPGSMAPLGSRLDLDALDALVEAPARQPGPAVSVAFGGYVAHLDTAEVVVVRREDATAGPG